MTWKWPRCRSVSPKRSGKNWLVYNMFPCWKRNWHKYKSHVLGTESLSLTHRQSRQWDVYHMENNEQLKDTRGKKFCPRSELKDYWYLTDISWWKLLVWNLPTFTPNESDTVTFYCSLEDFWVTASSHYNQSLSIKIKRLILATAEMMMSTNQPTNQPLRLWQTTQNLANYYCYTQFCSQWKLSVSDLCQVRLNLVGWFYSMSSLVGLFNAEVIPFLFANNYILLRNYYCLIMIILCLLTVIWLQVIQYNTNNLKAIIWFQVSVLIIYHYMI